MSNNVPSPREPRRWWQRLELWGRRLLTLVLARLLGGGRHASLVLPESPRFLVVRLDERVGNLVMLTPMLQTLRESFPAARIDVLGYARGRALLGSHPAVDRFIDFRKRALFSKDGPLRTPFALRRDEYSVAIDASNPRDPSFTQAALVSFSGAGSTIGSSAKDYGGFFSHPVSPPQGRAHEIDLRLALLEPLSPTCRIRTPRLAKPPSLPRALDAVIPRRDSFVVVNLGARLPSKQLSVKDYVDIAATCAEFATVVLSWGPNERDVALAVYADSASVLAPSTSLSELHALFASATAVVSCDTGPMHVAVATGTATLGIFVATDPQRFGYCEPPHAWVDAREAGCALAEPVRRWLEGEVFVSSARGST